MCSILCVVFFRYNKYTGDDLVALIVMVMKVALDQPLNL